MKTSCVGRGLILRLGKVDSPTSLALDLIMTLSVVALNMEKVMPWPVFSLTPTA